jgi:LSD1 subclass zinc finger protein
LGTREIEKLRNWRTRRCFAVRFQISQFLNFQISQCPRFRYNPFVMIAKDLLQILVCPACKQALHYRENPESLKCSQCHRVYPVKDNIPIMLVDEATVEI